MYYSMNYNTYQCSFDNNVELKVIIYNGDDNNKRIMYRFYQDGSLLLRESKKRTIMSNLIKKNIIDHTKNMIDGGSFLGDTTLPLCLQIKGTVYSIDPGTYNIEIINELSLLNNITNIKILKYCLGSKCETLYYNNSLYNDNFNNFSEIKGDLENTIDSISIDELYNRRIIENIDFIHIDVENLESSVLKGSICVIQRYNPIIIFEGHIKSYIQGVKESFTILYDMNYIIYMIDEDAGNIDDARNFIAIPYERHTTFIENCDYLHYMILYTI